MSDVADADAVERLADTVIRELGRVDVDRQQHGRRPRHRSRPVVDVDLDVWRHVIDVNLHGSFYMSRSFGRCLIEQGDGGSITNISSVAGKLFPAARPRTGEQGRAAGAHRRDGASRSRRMASG